MVLAFRVFILKCCYGSYRFVDIVGCNVLQSMVYQMWGTQPFSPTSMVNFVKKFPKKP